MSGAGIGFLQFVPRIATLDAREGQHLLDEPAQPSALAADNPIEIASLGLAEIALLQQGLAVEPHDGDGCLQLMA